MSLLFLVPLAITLIAIYGSSMLKDNSGEVAIGATAIGLIGFVLTLILAPWEVQLVLLLLILSRTRWVSLLNMLFFLGKTVHPASSASTPNMHHGSTDVSTQLVPDPASDATPSLLVCKYRGSTWIFDPNTEAPKTQSVVELKYRGAVVH